MKFSYLGLAILFFSLLFACSKDDNLDIPTEQRDNDELLTDQKKCFEFVFPLTYIMPNGTKLDVNSEEEQHKLLKDWIQTSTDLASKPELNYPVQVIFRGYDAILDINSEEELIELKKKCSDRLDEYDDARKCIQLVYPLVYLMPDGTRIKAGSAEELRKLIKNWYNDHPDVLARPVLQYPIEIIFFGREGIIIKDEETLRKYKRRCNRYNDRPSLDNKG